MDMFELKLKILQKTIEINAERNIQVAKRLLDYNHNEFPIIFNYQKGVNLKYVKYTLEGMVELFRWLDYELVAMKNYFSLDYFLTANLETIEYWRNLKSGAMQQQVRGWMKSAIMDVKIAAPGQSIKIETNLTL